MMAHSYTLTAITGRKASERRTVTFGTVEWQPRVLAVTAVSAVVAIPVTALTWVVLGPFALFAGAMVVVGALWLFLSKTKDSRDMSRFQDLRDRANSRRDINRFYLAGHEVDPAMSEQWMLRATMAPMATSPSSREPW